MFRVYARSAPLHGLPAFGLAIAGGTGNGLISGLRPIYHFFHMLQMRALEPVPAIRFNFNQALTRAAELGGQIAGMAENRSPFEDWKSAWSGMIVYPIWGLVSPGSAACWQISSLWRQLKKWAVRHFQALHDLTLLPLPGEV